MKFLIIPLLLCNLLMNSQIEHNANGGIGTGLGSKSCYGIWGVFYNYNPQYFNKRVEFNAGVGTRDALVLGAGAKFRFFDDKKRIETLLSVNYSYQLKGEFIHDIGDSLTDTYNTSSIQYIHCYLTGRFWIGPIVALQLNGGYSKNISGFKIDHTGGPNYNYDLLKGRLKSGVLFGIDFIVYINFSELQPMNQSPFK